MSVKTLQAAVLAGVLAGVLPGWPAHGFTLEEFTFDTPAQQAEFRGLIDQLRCLVCQNESLSASPADLAQDLRREVYQMMRSGKSKAEVVDFLVARYGDFVLYEPPIKPSTYVLWFGPLALGLLGALVLLRTLKAKGKDGTADLSPDERERLASVLVSPPLAAEGEGPGSTARGPGKGAAGKGGRS
jgi:cytochrome c-type biogenesis protein CcmH